MAGGAGAHPIDWGLPGGIRVRSTGCPQGDLGATGQVVEDRRCAVVDLPWTVLDQVHGARVVVVDGPKGASGEAADAAASAARGVAVAVLTADCAPVAFGSPEGVFGIAHAGWRGLRAGVVEATVTAMRRLGATRVDAVLGPCIHPCCYTFSPGDLDSVSRRLGDQVRATDREGRPAVDLPAGVRAAVHLSGATVVGDAGICTSCSDRHWSWRARGDTRRQATVVWRA